MMNPIEGPGYWPVGVIVWDRVADELAKRYGFEWKEFGVIDGYRWMLRAA